MRKIKLKFVPALLALVALMLFIFGLALLNITGAGFSAKNLSYLAAFSVLFSILIQVVTGIIYYLMGEVYVMDAQSGDRLHKYIRSASAGKLREGAENFTMEKGRGRVLVPLGDFHQSITSVMGQSFRLTDDLRGLTHEIIEQSGKLARASESQIDSVAETGQSLSRIDSGIRQIHNNVDELKNLSQETSSAGYQMTANIQQVSEMTGELAGLVRDLVTAIAQMATNIQSVAHATESLSSASTKTSGSMREIDQAASQIRKRAEESARLAAAAREQGGRAGNVVSSWALGMEKIEASVNQATKVMTELAAHSQEIGEIITVISDIASETHLLSLNASIMAAKAGEQGRGFMVVATEIKDLARRTSDSTKEIEGLINRTRRAVKEAQDTISQAYERAREGIRLSSEARQSIAEVQEEMESSAKYSRQIAEATEAQVGLANQVYQSSSEVDERTQLIKTAMREQDDSSAYLKERAEKMRDLTERVKIATKEQAESSQRVSKAMEELTASVEVIRIATEDQSKAGSEIIKAMGLVKRAADLIAISVENVENTAVSVLDQSLILGGEFQGFELPELKMRMKIGIVLDNLREERWQREREILARRCKRLGAEVLETVASGDAGLQLRQAEELIAQGAQGLIIVSIDAERIAPAVELAQKRGVKVIAYDRLIRNCEYDLFVAYDGVQIGRWMAEYCLKRKPAGNYFLLMGSETDSNSIWLREGQKQALEPAIKAGKARLIGESWTPDWSPEKAYAIVRSLLSSGAKPDAIIASNDGTAGGAVKALKEAGLAGKVLVTGMDAETDACKRIVKGEQSMTIYMPLRLQATRAAEALVLMLKGQQVPGADQREPNGKTEIPAILLHPISVDAENMREVIVADGFHTEKELYSA